MLCSRDKAKNHCKGIIMQQGWRLDHRHHEMHATEMHDTYILVFFGCKLACTDTLGMHANGCVFQTRQANTSERMQRRQNLTSATC